MNNYSYNHYIYAILISISFLLASSLSVHAQSNINIDEQSLEKINRDAITGLKIDKIGTDHSNRPCARLKIHINRMPIHELRNVEVRPIGGNVMVNRHIVSELNNGIIVEMTANPAIRLFLHHPKYGDSNIISVSMEPDKEYKIEASLNEYFSIIINTDHVGAETYLDGMAYGKTGSDKSLTIPDIMVGRHHVKVSSNGKTVEQDIIVTRTDIAFNIVAADRTKKKNYLVFTVEPHDALLQFNGEYIPLDSGTAEKFLNEGTYKYKVTANDYHSEEGEIRFDASAKKIVNIKLRPAFGTLRLDSPSLQGAKVYIDNQYQGEAPLTVDHLSSGNHTLRLLKEMYKPYVSSVDIKEQEHLVPSIELIPNFCEVILSVADNAYILINGVNKGRGKWTGPLEYGLYEVECRADNHKSSLQTIEVIPGRANRFMLETPAPIYTSLKITSEPTGARVEIDGKFLGETPLFISEQLTGKHEISAEKGKSAVVQEVYLTEKEEQEIRLELKQREPSYISWILKAGYNLDMGFSSDPRWSGADIGSGYNVSFAFHHHPSSNSFYWGVGLDLSTVLSTRYLPTINIFPTIGCKAGKGLVKFDPHLSALFGYDLKGKKFRYGGEFGLGFWFGRLNLDLSYSMSNISRYNKLMDDIFIYPMDIIPGSLQIKIGVQLGKTSTKGSKR